MNDLEFVPFEEFQQSNSFSYKQINEENDQQNIQDNRSSSSNEILQSNSQNLIVCQKDNQQKQLQFISINTYLNQPDFTINLMTGLSITSDGIVRLQSNLNQVSFGFQQQSIARIEDKKSLGIIDIKLVRNNTFIQNTLEDAVKFLQHVPNHQYNDMQLMLQKSSNMVNYLQFMLQDRLPSTFIQEKDEEFKKFINFCYYNLEMYNQNNTNQMYWYNIGRVNYDMKDMEYVNMGYSKSYLELLGLDTNSISQILLRNKKLDLIKNKLDINILALQGLKLIDQDLDEELYVSEIVTFDGFPIKITQKKKNYNHLFKSNNTIQGFDCEYVFMITEIDIDIYDLQQLIQYRQRISQTQKGINIDDYLKRELSYLFEDVEYSVQSQSFIEKFYLNNIQKLKEKEKLKINSNITEFKN